MKKLIIIVFLFCGSAAMAQQSNTATDTFYVQKVLVKNQLINVRNGRVMRAWWRKTKVKSGYIVKQDDGTFLINGKLMFPDTFVYSFNDTVVKK